MGEKLAVMGGQKVRKNPFVTTACIGNEEKRRVHDVLNSGVLSGFVAKKGAHFLGGKQVRDFESLIERYFKVPYAIALNSATAGLHAALAACGVGPGDEVIVTPYTMSASATAILMCHAIPVFVDIDEATFCIDPQKIAKAISPRTKAIVVVHLFGNTAAMSEICAIALKRGLLVVEDCAQAPGAKYEGKLVGTFADVGVFSLNQHKTVTSGEGGFCITGNENLALRIQLIRNHGEVIIGDMGVAALDNMIGYNYRMTELEAAISIGQFRRLDFLNKHRIGLAEYLTKKISVFKGLVLPYQKKGSTHVYFTYPIRFQEKQLGISRNIFAKALNAEGIPVGTGYVKPIYLEPAYQQKIGFGTQGCPFNCKFYEGVPDYRKGLCLVAERMHENELLLIPVCRYPHTRKDMDDVVRAFKKVYQNLEVLRAMSKNELL